MSTRTATAPPLHTAAVALAWALLSALAVVLALPHRAAPGLNYDEAALAGLARDLLSGHVRAEHVPTASTIVVGGRPLPWVMAGYYGAIKSWMFAPVFAAFGATTATLRMASLAWALLALLLAMLWAGRLAGTLAGVLTGALLVLDPSFFFIVVHDWGPAVPGFVCRFAGLLLSLLAWRSGRDATAFAAGAAFGLAFWAKIDSAVPIALWALSAALAWPDGMRAALSTRRRLLVAAGAGLFV
ncbi:MAG: glycosyltransferase family 39 protein [Alphaproteobacteria bacterium]